MIRPAFFLGACAKRTIHQSRLFIHGVNSHEWGGERVNMCERVNQKGLTTGYAGYVALTQ